MKQKAKFKREKNDRSEALKKALQSIVRQLFRLKRVLKLDCVFRMKCVFEKRHACTYCGGKGSNIVAKLEHHEVRSYKENSSSLIQSGH